MSKARLPVSVWLDPGAGGSLLAGGWVSRWPTGPLFWPHEESEASLPQEAAQGRNGLGGGLLRGHTLGTETLGGLGSTHSCPEWGHRTLVASARALPLLYTLPRTLLPAHQVPTLLYTDPPWGLERCGHCSPPIPKENTMPCKASSSGVLNQSFWSIGLIQTLEFVPQRIPGLRPPLNHRS